MLLGNRKEQKHTQEKNWCVVLNTIDSEITKKKVARKMSEVFILSGEEATDLVNNTPIILLDNLSRSLANKLKQYFTPVTRDMLLTNDVLRKRKYYRTVWPEEPNLSFLHNWEPSRNVKSTDEKLNAEEALDEIRSIEAKNALADSPKKAAPAASAAEAAAQLEKSADLSQKLNEELESLREKSQESQRLIEQLRLEKSELENQRLAAEQNTNGNGVTEGNEEIQKLQTLLKQSNDRYEVLTEEFRETRELFEEKVHPRGGENNSAVESAASAASLQEIETLKGEIEALRFGVAQKDERSSQLQRELETLRETKASDTNISTAPLEEWRLQIAQAEQKIRMFEKVNADMEKAFEEKSAKVEHWRTKYREVQEELDHINDTYNDLVRYKNQTQQKYIEIESAHVQLTQSLEQTKLRADQFESRAQHLEKEVETLKGTCATQEKIVQTNLQHLEMKEEELSSLRTKYRKVQEDYAERESSHRREAFELKLAAKESRLRELIESQQKLEASIRSQEEDMRVILKEQEAVEKDLLQGREEFLNIHGKSPNTPS